MDKFERDMLEEHQFQMLDLVLCATLAWWWGTHKDKFTYWKEYKRMMKLRFGYANTYMIEKYIGKDDLHEHLA